MRLYNCPFPTLLLGVPLAVSTALRASFPPRLPGLVCDGVHDELHLLVAEEPGPAARGATLVWLLHALKAHRSRRRRTPPADARHVRGPVEVGHGVGGLQWGRGHLKPGLRAATSDAPAVGPTAEKGRGRGGHVPALCRRGLRVEEVGGRRGGDERGRPRGGWRRGGVGWGDGAAGDGAGRDGRGRGIGGGEGARAR